MLTLFSFLLRLCVLAFATVLVAGATLTVAAERVGHVSERPTLAPAAPPPPANLTVPDVQGQAYVFAKGMLQDAGLAWHVAGQVKGFASNLVSTQDPPPGTQLVDTGSPLVTLTLGRNPGYAESGTPENDSPYPGTGLTPVAAAASAAPAQPAATLPPTPTETAPVTPVPTPTETTPAVTTPTPTDTTPAAPATTTPTTAASTTALPTTVPVQTVQAPAPSTPATTATTQAAPPTPTVTSPAAPPVPPATQAAANPNDFAVPGAPSEPPGETLPARAQALATWIESNGSPTPVNLNYWLYEHAYVVAGARFGWWHGADALRTLIAVDRRAESLWRVGPENEQTAGRALAEVEAKAK